MPSILARLPTRSSNRGAGLGRRALGRVAVGLMALGLVGCGLWPVASERPALPESEGFPDIYGWGAPVNVVHDDEAQTTRQIFRSPDGQAWAKVHHPLRQVSVIRRVDVRRLAPGGPYAGWAYESWDPARRAPIEADAETCHLCHSMAPANGTYTQRDR